LPAVQLQAVAHCSASVFETPALWSGVSKLVYSCPHTCPSSPCVAGRLLTVQLCQLPNLLSHAVVHLLVKRLQSVWVGNDPSVTQDVSEVRDIVIFNFSIIFVPGYSRSSLCSPSKAVEYCLEGCGAAPWPDCEHAGVLATSITDCTASALRLQLNVRAIVICNSVFASQIIVSSPQVQNGRCHTIATICIL
jgi:hypothetical protein